MRGREGRRKRGQGSETTAKTCMGGVPFFVFASLSNVRLNECACRGACCATRLLRCLGLKMSQRCIHSKLEGPNERVWLDVDRG